MCDHASVTRGRETGKEFPFSGKTQPAFTQSKTHGPSAPGRIQLKYWKSKPQGAGPRLTEVKVGWLELGVGSAWKAERVTPQDETELSSGGPWEVSGGVGREGLTLTFVLPEDDL